ncbi:HAMP domain-containing protein [Exiguobacterium sp. SH3S2]|uniref:sensor histidine kinase n=1 Tax=unclassified Exiguobacterium TaxID=2644629 RepID=UPI00103D91FD|nr:MULTISPECIES: sensor histidine kinase [unclassified Exiguobacterium]TCI44126.1 HAMP domain-containing protein [Exiguobacterium sp. SH3S3]TCI59583.1 HAMP domain-containing protein [Exiguobacterium sp. SH3S2]
MNKWFKQKLGRDITTVLYSFLALALVGSMIMYVQMETRVRENEARLQQVDERINRLNTFWDEWQSAQYDSRGYLLFGDVEALERAQSKENEFQQEINWFKAAVESKQGEIFAADLQAFHDFYFNVIMPVTAEYGQLRASGEITESTIDPETILTLPTAERLIEQGVVPYDPERGIDTLAPIQQIESSLMDYKALMNSEKNRVYADWKVNNDVLQFLWIASIFSFAALILLFVQPFLRRQTRLISRLSVASDRLLKGEIVDLSDQMEREDEIGTMSRSFNKMAETLRENERHLIEKNHELQAQQEELIAQQEELQAQQQELEEILEQTQQNEQHLAYRNELTETLAARDSLTAYPEIIEKLVAITDSEVGALVFLDATGSFSITSHGLNETLSRKLLDSENSVLTRAMTLRTTVHSSKQVASDHPLPYPYYMYETAVPVHDPTDDSIIAFIYLVRYKDRFTQTQMGDIMSFARQLSLSLLRMRLFEEMTREKGKTERILDSIREAVIYVEHSTDDVFVNRPLYEMFPELDAITSSQLAELSWNEWRETIATTVDQDDDFMTYTDRLFTDDFPHDSVSFSIRKGEMNLQMYAERIVVGGLSKGTLLVFRDITSETEAERLKSEFISTISHELRTPLSSIYGFTELMVKKQLPNEKQAKYLQTIHAETERLTHLVNDFLDVQRMESGSQMYDREQLDIEPVIHDMMTFYEASSLKHQFELVTVDDRPYELFADCQKFKQLMSNLLSNAVKYSPRGGKITVELAHHDQSISIKVKDQGIGIPSDALDRLFDKFYRVDNSDSREIGGTGLGLPICQEIVRGHAGQIHVESVQHKGSTFTVVIPSFEHAIREEEQTTA